MRLDMALKRVGVTIVKSEKRPDGGIVLMLRVDRKMSGLWNDTLTEFLLASAGEKIWRTDVSKFFYPVSDEGVVKFLWRVVLLGDVAAAGAALGRAGVRAVQQGVEVTSMPLVGRKNYPFDPANGKIAGAHDSATAQKAIAIARGNT